MEANIGDNAAMYQNVEYPWQRCYLAALMEMDKKRLAEKMAVANGVIRARAVEDNVGREERQALADAMNAMRGLC